MNSSLQRSIALVCAFILLSLCLNAQKKSYTDYYFEAKAMTDSLKTYQIFIQAHDSIYPFVSFGLVKNEVGKSFNFLNIKKRVDTNPDFVIKIIVSDVDAKVNYSYRGITNEHETYDIFYSYDVSFALSFETEGKTSVYIPLCTKKHYQKKTFYTLQNTNYNNSSNKTPIKTVEQKMPVHQYAEQSEIFLNTRSNFIIDFNEELIKFRKKK